MKSLVKYLKVGAEVDLLDHAQIPTQLIRSTIHYLTAYLHLPSPILWIQRDLLQPSCKKPLSGISEIEDLVDKASVAVACEGRVDCQKYKRVHCSNENAKI